MTSTATSTVPVVTEKKKRVQVHAACIQCKKAHAACSHTRPCDRCIRTNQPDACTDGAQVRVKRAKDQPLATSSPPDISLPLPDSVFIPLVAGSNVDVPSCLESTDLSYLLLDPQHALDTLPNDLVFDAPQYHTQYLQDVGNFTSNPSDGRNYNLPPASTIAPNQTTNTNYAEFINTRLPNFNAVPDTAFTNHLWNYVKHMEGTVHALKQEVEGLREDLSALKAQKSVTPLTKMVGGGNGYGHAVWSLPDLFLVECNQDFINLLGCQILPFQPFCFQHFLKLEDSGDAPEQCQQALTHSLNKLKLDCKETGEPHNRPEGVEKLQAEFGAIKKKFRRFTGESFMCAIAAQLLPEKNIIVTTVYEA